MSYLQALMQQCWLFTFKNSTNIDINNTAKFWLVHHGAVDIFFIQKGKGEEIAPRKHIFRAKKGDVIFGLPLDFDREGLTLVASGIPGTKIFQCDVQEAVDMAKQVAEINVLAAMLNRWLLKLFSGLVLSQTKPTVYKTIACNQHYSVSQGDILHANKRDLVWLQPHDNNLIINSEQRYGKLTADSYFSLLAGNWLQVANDCEFVTFNTSELIIKGLFARILHDSYAILFHCFLRDFQTQTQNEIFLLQQKQAKNKLAFSQAITKLKRVLFYKKANDIFVVDKQDPLYAACYVAAKNNKMDLISKELYQQHQQTGTIEELAKLANLAVRKVRLTEGWSRHDNGTLIAFLNNKPVVLLPLGTSRYELYDPTTGLAEIVTTELESRLKSEAYMLYRSFTAQPVSGKKLFKFGMLNTRKDLWYILLIGIGGGILSLLIPIMTGIVFDNVIPYAAYGQLVQIGCLLIFAVLSIAVFNFARNIAMLRIEGKFNLATQTAVWDRLINLPTSFFRNFNSGDLALRAMGINTIMQRLSSASTSIIISIIFSTFNFILLFYYSWQMACLAFGISLVFVVFTIIIGYFLLRYSHAIQELYGKLSGMTYQFINGIIKLRLTNTEERIYALWVDLFSKQQNLELKEKLLNNLLNTFYAIFPTLALIMVFMWFALYSLHSLSVGAFLAFNTAFISLQNSMLSFGLALPVILSVFPLYRRIQPILQAVPETTYEKFLPGQLSGDIKIEGVDFAYGKEAPVILHNISIEIKPKEFVAIVGETGSGKSTIFRLLLGFEQPKQGSIYYDNKKMVTLNVQAVRNQIGVVLQNSKLMSGSIYENIASISGLELDEAYEMASLAGLGEDIKAMPMGMHTFIGVGGSLLSEGQRQRLVIARALAKKPRMLLFDEATSALDNKTQAIVSKTLEKLQVTRIVIAHRLSTIVNADRIYVLHQGKIVQQGEYNQLMQEEGFFRILVKKQLL